MDDLKQIWQEQEIKVMKLSLEEVRTKAAKFHRLIKWRNWREYAAAVIVVVVFGIRFLQSTHTLERLAYALLIAWAIYFAWYLHAKGSGRSIPADMGRSDSMSFYRSELARQRDLLRTVWKSAIVPLIPGLVLLSIYRANVPPGEPWFQAVLEWVPIVVICWALIWLNLRGARRLDRRIAELDRELLNT